MTLQLFGQSPVVTIMFVVVIVGLFFVKNVLGKF